MSNFMNRFLEWQNYVHYLALTGIVTIVAMKFGAPINFKMFLQLFATILVGDTTIHGIFWVLPKPFRWRD